MSTVLIIIPHYLPGYKSGGPQQTVQNICDVYSSSNDIYIATQNVDFGCNEPYDLETNIWLKKYGVNIMYVEPKNYNSSFFRKLYDKFDVIYTCGLFCKSTIDFMLLNKQSDEKKLYVAPMGVFSENALAIRGPKKRLFLKCFSAFGMFRKIIWSFTSEIEKNEAINAIGCKNIRESIIAEDLPRNVDFQQVKRNIDDYYGPLRVIFLSRIVPKKNLSYALEILKEVTQGIIQFDIYGFQEDKAYWNECERVIEKLPSNIICNYCGGVNSVDSVNTFAKYDIFLFPTLGENFGHVIYEALAAGCIPIISDTTPWKNIEVQGCGRVIELQDIERFREVIREYLNCDPEELKLQKMNAIEYAKRKYYESIETSGYKSIFNMPVNRGEE